MEELKKPKDAVVFAEAKSPKGTVLFVDDDTSLHELFAVQFPEEGYTVVGFDDATKALSNVEGATIPFDVVVSDLNMPGMDGLEFISRIKALDPDLPVVLITAHGSVDSAVQAMKRGASDFIEKPINFVQLGIVLERNLSLRKLRQDNRSLKREMAASWRLGDLIGKSAAMKAVFSVIERVASSSAHILITGESGTGKEVVARAIHNHSPRNDKPCVTVNCAAIPENLLESELFGHKRGSFSGATENRIGLFQEASGGTLFLDEIGEMPLELQAKLLRAIQDKKIRPVGENKDREIDVRILAATNVNLRDAIKAGDFREDLYFRLSVIPIEIPPLRNRREDIPLLASHFLNKFSSENGKSITRLSPKALAKLVAQRWDGNVRQLQNAIERAVILCEEDQIAEKDIVVDEDLELEPPSKKFFANLPTLEQLEKEYIQYVLMQTHGRKEKAASILGVNRKTLYRKEQELNEA
ncbi:MAG: sigma-54 dependent transcriptional regulator [Bdellovibrionota bacterium]